MRDFIDITEQNKNEYNSAVTHPLQSYEWGEFRKKTGVTVIRRGLLKNEKVIDGFTVTIHKIPRVKFTIGYLPKGNKPTAEILEELKRIGKEHKCIFIQLEPNLVSSELRVESLESKPSFHPLFTKYTFVLNIEPTEEELLKAMHSKTRYNIRVAEKHNVQVLEDDSEIAFKEYLKLTHETTTRQKFYAHSAAYHTTMWETLKPPSPQSSPIKGEEEKSSLSSGERVRVRDSLVAHLLTATYQNKTLVSWILFTFHDTLYYPYGASSSEHRNVMASNLIMWEAIKFGKKHGLTQFDMWGALGPEPDPNDPWIGFHKFKQGYGATLTEFVGSYDLVINPLMYQLYKVGDKVRWVYLRIRK